MSERAAVHLLRHINCVYPTLLLEEAIRIVQNRAGKMDYLVFAAIIVAWIVLQAWILPKFGVQT